LLADGFIDRCSTKGDASRLTVIQPSPLTAISDDIATFARILHHEFPAASSATQQTTQKSRSFLNSPGLLPAPHIVADRQLDLFELLPADIALVRIWN